MKNLSDKCLYEFDRYRLLPAERLLLRGEEPVQLAPKVFDTLLVLVERGGHLVEKEELLEQIWTDSFVEESTLARNISILRKVLGEKDDGRKYIETVPKRGYRFTEPVVEKKATAEPLAETEPRPAAQTAPPVAPESFVEPEPPIKPARRPVLFLITIFVVAVGVLASLSFWSAKTPAGASGVKSIAVLPFRELGASETNPSLELGMADAVITRLGKFRQLVVRQTSSVSKYLENETDAVQAGRDLQTDAVLEGTIQREGARLRVTARLVKIDDGSQLWAETFNARFTDIFSVQDSISAQIAESLNLKLSEGIKRPPARSETESPEAYALYLKGRYFWEKRTPEGLLKALESFTQAKDADPAYASAYAGMADCYVLLGEYRLMPAAEAFSKARMEANRALELDAENAEARSSKAYILAFYDWDWAGAEKEFKRVIEQNPNYATAHQWYAELLQVLGRFDESLALFRRAEEVDPRSLIIKTGIAGHFYLTRNYDESIAESRKIIEMEPNFGWGYGFLWLSQKEKKNIPEALAAHQQAQKLFGIDEPQLEARQKAFARAGWNGYWLEFIRQNEKPANRQKLQSIDLAAVYAQIGDREKALAALEQSYQARERWLPNIKYAPQFDPLRDDARFAELLRRMGLEK